MSSRDEEFREFARSRAAPLHRSAYLLCGDWHLAHDLVQDTFVKAYRHWHRVQQADSPDAYVRRILLNEARKRWRRRENAMPVARITTEPVVLDAADEMPDVYACGPPRLLEMVLNVATAEGVPAAQIVTEQVQPG